METLFPEVYYSIDLLVIIIASMHVPLHAVYVSISGGGDQLVGQTYTLTCQVNAGGHAVMSVYQWIKDGTEITDETSATLSFSPLADTDFGDYTCRATVRDQTTTSASVTIGVGKNMQYTYKKCTTDHYRCDTEW